VHRFYWCESTYCSSLIYLLFKGNEQPRYFDLDDSFEHTLYKPDDSSSPSRNPSRKPEASLNFICKDGDANQTFKLSSTLSWAEARTVMVNTLNVLPKKQATARLGYKFRDQRPKEPPFNLASEEDFKSLVNEMVGFFEHKKKNPRAKERLPVEVFDLEVCLCDPWYLIHYASLFYCRPSEKKKKGKVSKRSQKKEQIILDALKTNPRTNLTTLPIITTTIQLAAHPPRNVRKPPSPRSRKNSNIGKSAPSTIVYVRK
jgi:hypothetical protein